MGDPKSSTAKQQQHPGIASASLLSQIGQVQGLPTALLAPMVPGLGPALAIGGLLGQLLKGDQASAPQPATGALPAAGAPPADEVWTVTDENALLRDPAQDYKSLGTSIPRWTQVHILETATAKIGKSNKTVVRVEDLQGTALGWTTKGNLTRFLKDQTSLKQCVMAPAADRQLTPPNDNAVKKAMAEVWNRIGNFLEVLAPIAGIELPLVLAIWYKESAGAVHTPNAMIIRLEAHVFRSRWKKSADASKPYSDASFNDHFRYCGRGVNVGDTTTCGKCEADDDGDAKTWLSQQVRFPAADGAPENSRTWTCVSPNGQPERYRVLDLARDLAGDEPALKSISMGGPQIMGFNHEFMGYSTARAMYDAFQAEERWQVLGFFDFVVNFGGGALLRAATSTPPDWKKFGTTYNGDSKYGDDLVPKYNSAKALLDTLKKTG